MVFGSTDIGRRELLATMGVVGASALAGCGASTETDTPATTATATPTTTATPTEVEDGPVEQAEGATPEGMERVKRVFEYHTRTGLHHGAQLAVYQDGELAVEMASGTTGPNGREDTPDTRHLIFSCTKPLAAACVHHLADQGELSFDDRIVEHWPEYAEEGTDKAKGTVRHALSHQTGMPEMAVDSEYAKWGDPDALAKGVEQAEVQFEPGSTAQYHTLSYGWIVGELVRQASGQTIDTYARENVFEPLGMEDTYIGLPSGVEDNTAKFAGFKNPDLVKGRAPDPNNNAAVAGLFNRESVHRGIVPAANGQAPARDLARFYAAYLNGGSIGGTDFIGSDVVDEVTSLEVSVQYSENSYFQYGLGFGKGGGIPDSYGISAPESNFGHGGFGSCNTWGDPDRGLAFVYLTNGIRNDYEHYQRMATMAETVREEL